MRLPEDLWPDEWKGGKYRKPVVRMRKALCGHPNAGGYWERHCAKQLRKLGWEPVRNWPSVFHHKERECLLMVYVDDFVMPGPPEGLRKGWEIIKQGLALDEPGDIGRCLGCHHRQWRAHANGKDVNVMEFVVSDFMISCVEACKKACGEANMKLRPVDTRFLPSPECGGDAPAPLEEGGEEGARDGAHERLPA